MMKRDFGDYIAFLAAAILLLVLAFGKPVQAHDLKTLRVTDDLGGLIGDYITTGKWLAERGYTVEIEGECASACTLFTLADTTCVIRGASLWFHAPFKVDPATGQKTFREAAILAVTMSYPEAIRDWIVTKGGLPKDGWIVLQGRELYDRVPICAATPTS